MYVYDLVLRAPKNKNRVGDMKWRACLKVTKMSIYSFSTWHLWLDTHLYVRFLVYYHAGVKY